MSSSTLLCDKLRTSSLFLLYQHAFDSVTGYHLDLRKEAGGDISVPVPIGKTEPCFLVANAVHPTVDSPRSGLLECFAMQLGDEANRAVLECHAVPPQKVRDAIHFLREHQDEKIQLEEVAEKVGLCSFQLCRLFKRHTGVTMTEYVNRLRVERARRRLENLSLQTSQVASQVGFASLSQFNRNFLKYAGESPSHYRKRLGKLEHCQLSVA
jgi:AraC-like DNA-binding protein